MKWIAASLTALAACTGDIPAHPTYDVDVAPILEANCIRCHGGPSDAAEARNCLRVDLWDSAADTSNL